MKTSQDPKGQNILVYEKPQIEVIEMETESSVLISSFEDGGAA